LILRLSEIEIALVRYMIEKSSEVEDKCYCGRVRLRLMTSEFNLVSG